MKINTLLLFFFIIFITLFEPQLDAAFEYIRYNVTTEKIIDPANSQNIISNDITIGQKNRIRKLAIQVINAEKWSQIFYQILVIF